MHCLQHEISESRTADACSSCMQEASREIASVWNTFRRDPLQPARDYWRNYIMTGIGLFIEGYVIFSISNNTVLFQHTYYDCWKSFTACNKVPHCCIVPQVSI